MDAHLGDSFRIEIAGIGTASFSQCRGLGAAVEVVAVSEGGRESPHLLPGLVHWEPIVLERGWVNDAKLWEWFQSRDARDGSIELLAPDGTAAGRWTFAGGWPSRWSGPVFDANRERIALEVLEIVHEGLRWEAR